MPTKNKTGTIVSCDLTIQNAESISKFYEAVVGWKKEGMNMGEYEDYFMKQPETGDFIAGVCHARGINKDLPPQWLLYIAVDDLDQSLEKCKELGGKVVGKKRKGGSHNSYCLIQDPAGAYMMLFGTDEPEEEKNDL